MAEWLLAGTLFTLIIWTGNKRAAPMPQPPCRYAHDGPAILPDKSCTPGAAVKGENPCADGFRTGSVRDVPESLKRKVYARYGAVEKQGVCCEADHLISLELGGSNDIKNLWPEPYTPKPGAHEKDQVEDRLHRAVCDGRMSLKEAQREISADWYAIYKEGE